MLMEIRSHLGVVTRYGLRTIIARKKKKRKKGKKNCQIMQLSLFHGFGYRYPDIVGSIH